jgi:hypothetical protein
MILRGATPIFGPHGGGSGYNSSEGKSSFLNVAQRLYISILSKDQYPQGMVYESKILFSE